MTHAVGMITSLGLNVYRTTIQRPRELHGYS